VQEYAYSFAKLIVGEAREKFASLPGPQGGTQLNGATLKGEAKAEMEKLEQELAGHRMVKAIASFSEEVTTLANS
jgi:hypothetical protein